MTRTDWERVTPLLERLLEVPTGRRREWLADECDGDTGLFRDVWSAYRSGTDDDAFLRPPLAEPREPEPETEPQEAGQRRIGPYRLIRVLGSGGMGTVWLAERADGQYVQRVALKVVKRGMDSADVVRRFRVERQVLAGLEHPGIARLLDGGTTAEGLPYLVMELVEGRPLPVHCEERGLDLAARLRLFAKVCETVHFAHERNVVHRDLKPSNVLVDAGGQPRLLDFGIAKVLEEPSDVLALEHTRTGERFLSPRHASPEQLRGEPVGPASDVYALGVMLYELVVGKHPHDGHTTSWREYEQAVIERAPEAPSRAAPGEARSLAGDVDTIVLTALRKEPERRYASAHALARDIELHLEGRPIHARPDTWSYRSAKFVRRHRGLVAGTLAFVALLVTALAITATLYASSRASAREARWQAYVGRLAAAASAIENLQVADARDHLRLAPEELRGWEWRHLESRLDHSLRTLSGGYTAVAVDPEHGRLAVARRGVIELLAIETLESRTSITAFPGLRSHWRGCLDVEFSPDGTLVASLWSGGDLFVHAAEDGRLLHRGDEARSHSAIAFRPDGGRLMVGLSDGAVEVLDPREGRVTARLRTPESTVVALAFAPDGGTLASGAWNGRIHLWNADLTLAHELRGHSSGIRALDLSSDGRQLVSSSVDGTVRVWDVASGAAVAVQPSGGGYSLVARWLSDGRILSSVGGAFTLWNPETRVREAIWLGHTDSPEQLVVAPGLSRAWSADLEDIKEWSLETEDLRTFRGCVFGDALAVRGDDERIASGGPDGKVRLWAFPSGAPVEGVSIDDGMVLGAAFARSGEALFTLDDRGRLTRHDLAGGPARQFGERGVAAGSAGRVELDIDLDGQRLLLSLGDRAEVVDVASGARLLLVEAGPGDGLSEACFDTGGERIAAGTTSGGVRIWDARTGDLLSEFVVGKARGAVRAVAFDPSGELLAAGHDDGCIRLWEVAAGRCVAEIDESGSEVLALSFHPDGERLVSAGKDGNLRFWQVPSGRAILTLSGHGVPVSALRFTRGGEALVSSGADGLVRWWETGGPGR
jgi:WD40 repeat protein/serine/threonine protein kinase